MIKEDTYELPIYRKAFLTLHGITGRRLQFFQKSLTGHGGVQKDKRGAHIKTKLPQETIHLMHIQINTLKEVNGRKGFSNIHKMNNETHPKASRFDETK